MNVLKPQKEHTVITLLQHGISQREICRKTGIDRKTIRRVGRALACDSGGGSPFPLATRADGAGGQIPPPLATGDEGVAGQIPPPRPPGEDAWSADTESGTRPACARSACESHRAWIEQQLQLGRNAVAIYQELVDGFGFTHRYNSVKRFCRRLRYREPEQFDRLEFLPGEEAQVDYGEGAPTRHPTSATYRKPRLFVMTLKYSRRSFRKVVWKSSSEIWARLHEEAFHYFQGCPLYAVLDNLREGVITPDLYEPELNRVYAAMLAHYGVVADPCRVRDPNRKGTVENAIQHTQGTALKGKRFESIDEQNAYLLHWEETWAAPRIHGRTQRQVEAMFQEERPHLKPLPLTSFRYFEDGIRTVQDDTTVQIQGAWYAARPAAIGTQVLVRIYEREIEIRDLQSLALIRRHPRATHKGEVQLPNSERVFNPSRQTWQILARAEQIGPHTQALCQQLFELRGREAHKSLWGIVGLVPRYPACIVEQAVARVQSGGLRSYKAVRVNAEQLLAQAIVRIGALGPSPASGALTQTHALIRDPTEYADFFNHQVREHPLTPPTPGEPDEPVPA